MKFAFLIHARSHKDLQKNIKFLKYFPKFIVEIIANLLPPVVIKEIKYKNSGQTAEGYLIAVLMSASQMLSNRERAKKKILAACRKAEKLNVDLIGLGALTSPLTDGGLWLKGKIRPAISTGNAMTVAVSHLHLLQILDENKHIKKIAIVGVTGSIGQALFSLLLEKHSEKEFYLFARTAVNLEKVKNKALVQNANIKIKDFLSLGEELAETDLIIVATSASSALIHSHHLKKGAIIYDVTQPPNIDKKALASRPDLTIYDGGLARLPGLKEKLPFGLPEEIVFSCFSEIVLLSLAGVAEDFVLGEVKIEQVKYIENLSKRFNITPNSL